MEKSKILTDELINTINERIEKLGVKNPFLVDSLLAIVRDSKSKNAADLSDELETVIPQKVEEILGKDNPEVANLFLDSIDNALHEMEFSGDLDKQINNLTPEQLNQTKEAFNEAQNKSTKPEDVIKEFSQKAPKKIVDIVKNYEQKIKTRLEKPKYNTGDITAKDAFKKRAYGSLVSALHKVVKTLEKNGLKTKFKDEVRRLGAMDVIVESRDKVFEREARRLGKMDVVQVATHKVSKPELESARKELGKLKRGGLYDPKIRKEEIETRAQQNALSEKPMVPPRPANLQGKEDQQPNAVKGIVSQFEQQRRNISDSPVGLSPEERRSVSEGRQKMSESERGKLVAGVLPKSPEETKAIKGKEDGKQDDKKGNFVSRLISNIKSERGSGRERG